MKPLYTAISVVELPFPDPYGHVPDQIVEFFDIPYIRFSFSRLVFPFLTENTETKVVKAFS